MESKPRYLRGLEKVSGHGLVARPTAIPEPTSPTVPTPTAAIPLPKPQPIYAKPGDARVQALRMVWPIVCRRLEGLPNMNAMQLFGELCIQFAGHFTPKQYKSLSRRGSLWRRDARARGVVIGPKTYGISDKRRGRRPDIFKDHWEEMAQCLEQRPDQTALELLLAFQARYPGRYGFRQLSTFQRRVRMWRRQAVQRLIGEVTGNIFGEAAGNRIT